MNAKTLKALKGSIAKWEAIVAGTGVDRGVDNCPLCQLFNNEETPYGRECNGCPVKIKTGHRLCHYTPYCNEWASVGILDGIARTEKQKTAARAELAFLKSLLPRKRK